MARRARGGSGRGAPRDPRARLAIALAVIALGYGANWLFGRNEPPAGEPRPPAATEQQRRAGEDRSAAGGSGGRRRDGGEAPGGLGETLPGVPPPPPRVEGIAPVATFNIEWFGKDGPKAGRGDADIEAIAEVVQATGAPLLGLQEIGDEETMDRLLRFLPGYRYVLGTSGRNQRCGILWDPDRASVGRAVEWPDVNRGLERARGNLRAPLAAPVRVGNFDFLFVVVHLKAMFDDEAIRTRRTQAQRLRARLDDWVAGNADKDVVVVGDFNDLPGSAALAEITGRRRGGAGSGASGFVNTGARLPESAVTYLGRTSRIDHIVVSSPAVSQEEWTGQVAIYPKPRGAARRAYEASVSDHLPSWATFKVDRDNDP